MKPQCNTSADCLRELARMMDQFWIDSTLEAVRSKYVKEHGDAWDCSSIPQFSKPGAWQFAIAEVEGKPVFIGDTLYLNDGTRMHVVRSLNGSAKFLGMRSAFDNQMTNDSSVSPTSVQDLSWNPPKPATVMVELTVEDAEKMARDANERLAGTYAYDRVGLACKKALDELK